MGGDFRHVDHIEKLQIRRIDLKAAIAVYGKIPKGVRKGCTEATQTQAAGQQDSEQLSLKSYSWPHNLSSYKRWSLLRSVYGGWVPDCQAKNCSFFGQCAMTPSKRAQDVRYK
jgi:hypothetical protein